MKINFVYHSYSIFSLKVITIIGASTAFFASTVGLVQNDFKKIYLETMPELKQALSVYEKFGFEYLKGPMGNSGHTGCSLWMLKQL
mgnify:CR=1 FL=1